MEAILYKVKNKLQIISFLIKSLFINEFISRKTQQVEFINEKKDRVTMKNIENFIKPLYQVFPKRLLFIWTLLILNSKIVLH